MSTIAQTILVQLGASRFVAMTGARNLVGREDGLQFDIPRAMNKANKVRITLTPDDLYTVEFMAFSRKYLTCDIVGRVDGLGCEELRGAFERATGLLTSL